MQHRPTTAAPPQPPRRHYGLDWLRIAAFALLILYHIGMVFAPWQWVIHTDHEYPALIVPMALLAPWRLPLLFAVSGFASRRLFERARDPAAFARRRALRLLVPLAFGMAVLVPLEMWVRVVEAGYPHGYLRFWIQDYWRFRTFHGQTFPSWEHLWFLAYLSAYTLLLAAVLATGGQRVLKALDAGLDWLCEGRRLLWFMPATLIVLKLGFLFVAKEEQSLVADWGGHAHFLPLFLFGFAAAGASRLWPTLGRLVGPAAALAAIAGAAVLWVETRYPGAAVPPHALMALSRAGAVTMAWAMILALFHLADRWWNRDHRWRRTLGEAVFPFYLVHQPAIVLIAWYMLPRGLGAGTLFAVLLAGTVAACLAVYLVGRRVAWLRPLIGLSPPAPSRRAAAAPLAEAR